MLEVESPGGKARAELIRERPRWQIDPTGEGPPRVSFVETAAAAPAGKRPAAPSAPRAESAPPAAEAPRLPEVEEPSGPSAARRTWMLIVFMLVVAGAGALQAIRLARRRPTPPSR
jgi:hypothetical protein